MKIEVLKSKIHGVTVTGADLNYIGSITIDETLMKVSNIKIGEKVQVVNINNGERLETYAIKGKQGSNIIALNGPAARLGAVGDSIFILSYAIINSEDSLNPILVDYRVMKGTSND